MLYCFFKTVTCALLVGNGTTEADIYISQHVTICVARTGLVPLCAEQTQGEIIVPAPKRLHTTVGEEEGKNTHACGQGTDRAQVPHRKNQCPVFSEALPVVQTAKRIEAFCVVLCSATRSAVQWNNLEFSINCDSWDPYHHKAVLPSDSARLGEAAGQTFSLPSPVMTSDPARLNKGFPTRKPV